MALASASRSSPAHAPAWCARAHSPSRPPPVPRLPLSRVPAATTSVPESPATSPSQPAAPARRSRNGSSAAADPEALLQPTARQLGCEPGSDFLAPVAAGWRAKAFKNPEPSHFRRVRGVGSAELRRGGRAIKSPWARGSPSPDNRALEVRGRERGRTRPANSSGGPRVSLSQEVGPGRC